MCGIAGVLCFVDQPDTVDQSLLQRMTDSIVHRGPDDEGHTILADGKVGFGFRRLSIVDLSAAGHQPMSTEDGDITLMFNGEIYNHLEIRADLGRRGYRYRSRTDTETILYAYREFGPSFVDRLFGMFAIAIWDSRSQTLLLYRDRVGIKPVYYHLGASALIFGSEIKSLLCHPALSRSIDDQAMYDYLSLMMSPPDQTMFSGVKKLEAGHYMECDRHGNVTTRCYWDLDTASTEYSDAQLNSEEFCVDELRRLLRDSIRLRMMADVPFGVLLSGGIDSSLNVALMSELMTRPVDTFSVGYRHLQKYNELEYARQIANQFGTNHREIFLEEHDLIEFLPRMVWHLDEPNADPVCVPMYFVSKLARESGTIVVQVGEGSDEQFAGYRHYQRELRFRRYYHKALPRFIRRLSYKVLRARDRDSLLTEYARRSAHRESTFYGGALSFSEESKKLLFTRDFRMSVEDTGRIPDRYARQLGELLGNDRSIDTLKSMIYYEFKNRLAELLLMRVDKMSMATSVEARVPFLDHRMVEFSFRIPSRMKVKGGEPKYILKKAAEGIIPNNIIYRRKQGFAAPVREWLREGALRTFARETILDSTLIRSSGTFDARYIESLFDRHERNTSNFDGQIWSLLVLALWDENFSGNG